MTSCPCPSSSSARFFLFNLVAPPSPVASPSRSPPSPPPAPVGHGPRRLWLATAPAGSAWPPSPLYGPACGSCECGTSRSAESHGSLSPLPGLAYCGCECESSSFALVNTPLFSFKLRICCKICNQRNKMMLQAWACSC
jgi:hypothetical protein